MNMILSEVSESLRRKKMMTFFLMLGILVFLLSVILIIISYVHLQEKESSVSSFKGLHVYRISDSLYEDSEFKAYLDEPEALDRLKHYYTYLEENLNETFIHVSQQPLFIPTDQIEIDESFLEGYEEGNPRPIYNDEYTVKTVTLNEQALNLFPIQVMEGETLTSEDFDHSNAPGQIPVLLGAAYSEYFEVGDHIKADYLFQEFELEVKGFLKENQFVSSPSEPEVFLDRNIVIPAQQFAEPNSEEEEGFQERHYFNLIWGAIYSESERDAVEAALEEAKAASRFPHAIMMGSPTTPLGQLFEAIAESIYWLLFIATVLFIVCIFGISMMVRKKIQDNYKNMMIHLISGGSMRQLFLYSVAEIAVLVGLPTILLVLVIMGFNVPLLVLMVIFLCALALMILAIIPLYLHFRRLPVSRLLKREE